MNQPYSMKDEKFKKALLKIKQAIVEACPSENHPNSVDVHLAIAALVKIEFDFIITQSDVEDQACVAELTDAYREVWVEEYINDANDV